MVFGDDDTYQFCDVLVNWQCWFQVFAMLDTQSVCFAAAACSFFHKCASDPLCYASIDLMTVIPKVNNLVVSTMIQRAGKALRYDFSTYLSYTFFLIYLTSCPCFIGPNLAIIGNANSNYF